MNMTAGAAEGTHGSQGGPGPRGQGGQGPRRQRGAPAVPDFTHCTSSPCCGRRRLGGRTPAAPLVLALSRES
jgi:hypothetical protein